MYGQTVIEKRKELNISREQLAAKSGLSYSTICNIEKGRNEATFQTRQMIDNVLYPNLKEQQPYGLRLFAKRKEKGYTLVELATKVKSSPSRLSEIEHGKQRPSVSLSMRLNEVLGKI